MADTLGHRIQSRREAIGQRRPFLAVAADVSEATVRRWELGITEPGVGHLAALADALGTTTDDLLGRAPAGQ